LLRYTLNGYQHRFLGYAPARLEFWTAENTNWLILDIAHIGTNLLLLPKILLMKTTPKFYRNLWGKLEPAMDVSRWDAVMDYYDQERNLDAFYALLDYINPQLRKRYGNPEQTKFSVPHGSVVVSIELKGDEILIDCPFVGISSAARIPLLRKIAEMNFSTLVLTQVYLSNNELTFRYRGKLEMFEPYKFYNVFHEICINADRHDDEFHEKFKASALVEPKVSYLTEQQIEAGWKIVLDLTDELKEHTTYTDSNRWYGTTVDLLAISLQRLDLALQIQGFLKAELERTVQFVIDNNNAINDRIKVGREFFQKLRDGGKDRLAKSLYEAVVFIPERRMGHRDTIADILKKTIQSMEKYNSDKNHLQTCIEALHAIYYLFYHYSMEEKVNRHFFSVLQASAEKPWTEASAILLKGVKDVSTLN
jgi:hypothetical protein